MLAMRLSRYAGACPGDRTLRAARREDRPDGYTIIRAAYSSWVLFLEDDSP